ncbi:MAG: hypothetical protein V3V18_13820 [Methylococcales bacterium]
MNVGSDQSASVTNAVALVGEVTDDGLPNPQVTRPVSGARLVGQEQLPLETPVL